MHDAPPQRWPEVLRRWSWLIAAQVIVLALLAVDRVPELRGYAPWPPEWQWTWLPGRNLAALPWMILAGAAIALLGMLADARRSQRTIFLCAMGAAMVLWQLSAVWLRGPDLGLHLAQRTMVPFLEDFFQAAQSLEVPGQAFTDFERLAEEENKLRIATHPPGMIWLYGVFLQWGEGLSSMGLGDGAIRFFSGEQHAAQLDRAGFIALTLATMVKLLGGIVMLGGVWLMLRALAAEHDVYTGRIMAAAALVPATSLFTASIDQLAMGLSTLAVGLLLCSVTRGPRWLAAFAGLALFLQSMIVFQFTVTIFIAGTTMFLLLWNRNRETWLHEILPPAAMFLLVPLALWKTIEWTTGYDLIGAVMEGTSAHREGAIHANRSRGGWLFFNMWDVFFFLGLAWTPLWLRRETWRGNPLVYTIVAAWVLMALFDAVRGETARVLLFLFPLLAMALSVRNAECFENRDYAVMAALLIAQTTCFAAVLNLY